MKIIILLCVLLMFIIKIAIVSMLELATNNNFLMC